MDIAGSLAPRSDQWNADDLVAGPIDVTISGVVKGKAEQPYDFLLEGSDRVFRPGVTMRRLMAAAWGTTDGEKFVGRSLRLYRDPDVRFGKDVTGGIRISHMSHLDKRFEVKLQTTRGKRDLFVVEPLTSAAALPPANDVNARIAALQAEWQGAEPDRQAEIQAEVAALREGL